MLRGTKQKKRAKEVIEPQPAQAISQSIKIEEKKALDDIESVQHTAWILL